MVTSTFWINLQGSWAVNMDSKYIAAYKMPGDLVFGIKLTRLPVGFHPTAANFVNTYLTIDNTVLFLTHLKGWGAREKGGPKQQATLDEFIRVCKAKLEKGE